MKRAVFLDRDGVINNDTGHYYMFRPEHLEINKSIIPSLKKIADVGFLLVVISNQAGIAKGLYAKPDTDAFHDLIRKEYRKHGIEFAEFYYCPHHPDYGRCLCRKPGSQMIEKALARFEIDPGKSYLIGDSERDVEAGKKAGVMSFRIPTNGSIDDICHTILTH